MKKRTYLTLIIFIALIFLMIFFVAHPLFVRVKNDSKELASQKESLANIEAKTENLQSFRGMNDDFEYFLNEVENLFIDPIIPIDFINFLEKVSDESGVEIEITPVSQEKKQGEIWTYIVFQITVISPFSDFLKFLEKIENNPYLVEVESVNINSLAQSQDIFRKNIRANFLIKAFTN